MSGWNSHVRLLPDSCVSRVIVRMPDFSMFSKNIAPTFLGNFSLRFQNFRRQKILVALAPKIRLISGIANKLVNKLFCINRICVSTYSVKKHIYFSLINLLQDVIENLIMFACKFPLFCVSDKREYSLLNFYEVAKHLKINGGSSPNKSQ
jgi:hypothetical protein